MRLEGDMDVSNIPDGIAIRLGHNRLRSAYHPSPTGTIDDDDRLGKEGSYGSAMARPECPCRHRAQRERSNLPAFSDNQRRPAKSLERKLLR